MSLEAAIEKLIASVDAQTAAINEVIGLTKTGGTTAAADDKPKTTRAKKDDKPAETKGTGPTFAELKSKLATWLGEFAKEEDKDNPAGAHPEVLARRDAVKKALSSKSVGAESLKDIENAADKVAIMNTWFEEKAKTVDKGHGIGRLVADPVEAEDAAGDDDDMGV